MTSQTGVNRLKGFTLVEVMLSVAILGIGLSVVANSYLSALRGITASQNNIQAQFLAKAEFETLEEQSLMNKGLSPFSETNTLKSAGRTYKYSLDITETSLGEPQVKAKPKAEGEPQVEEIVQVCLRYSWQEQNAQKNAVFSSYFPRHAAK